MRATEHGRIYIFLGFLFAIAGLITYQLFRLSVVHHAAFSRTAQAQRENITNLLARGNIYLSDRTEDRFLAATNKKFPVIYAVSDQIDPDSRGQIISDLVRITGLEASVVDEKIGSTSSSMRVILRRVSDQQVFQIKDLKTKGLGVSYELDRFYPGESLAANVIGFLGYDSTGRRSGQYGVEGYYNEELFGSDRSNSGSGIIQSAKKVSGIKSFFSSTATESSGGQTNQSAQPANIVLTIDKNIQTFVEDRLENLLTKWSAEKGIVIVQEPKTGKILAMADRPTFNPNTYGESETEVFLNSAVQEIFEPGSSFKPVTMATGLDLAKISPQTTYTDTGFVEIAGRQIRNFDDQAHGVKTMTQVLEKSLNTGTMFVQNLIGDDGFLNYLVNFGFGQGTGVDLPGEVSGNIDNLYSKRKINYLTASFGQGIAVTPLQLINAYSALANGGRLMRPYIVERVQYEDGQEIATEPEVVSIPISDRTSQKIATMLTSVVDNGFDKARISGYDVAGKTGTAQIPAPGGGYLEHEFIHNFVGFAPSYEPRFVVLLKIDKPRGIAFASDSLSPTFKEIAEFLINYYGIAPTRK